MGFGAGRSQCGGRDPIWTLVDGDGNVIASTGSIIRTPARSPSPTCPSPRPTSHFGVAGAIGRRAGGDLLRPRSIRRVLPPTGHGGLHRRCEPRCARRRSRTGPARACATNTPQWVMASSRGSTRVTRTPALRAGRERRRLPHRTGTGWSAPTGDLHLRVGASTDRRATSAAAAVVGITPTAAAATGWWHRTAGSSPSATPATTAPSPGRAAPAGTGVSPSSMRRSSAWCPPPTAAGTSWWRRTAGSSPSGTPGSRVCPGIGGCSGRGRGRRARRLGQRLLGRHAHGAVYPFGNAADYGAPGPRARRSPLPSPPPTARLLDPRRRRAGLPFGDAAGLGGLPAGSAGGPQPGVRHLRHLRRRRLLGRDRGSARSRTSVTRPTTGSMSGTHLNGPIIAASGS